MPTFFEKLIAETRAEQMEMTRIPQIMDACSGRITRESYIAYLSQAYHHVRHTVPLMMAAGARLPQNKEFLRSALVEYVREEAGHQEWILNDIRNADGDAETVRNGQPNAATEMMVAYAYDFIHRINPAGFFGMVFVLEGTSTALATNAAGAIQSALGLPATCFSYLRSHGSLDIDHLKYFEKLINQIDDPEDQSAIIHMARRMFLLFGNVFRSIPHTTTEARHAAIG